MPGSGRRSQCIMHWLPGFVRCLKDAGQARCWAQQILCGAVLGSGLAFRDFFFCISSTYIKLKIRILNFGGMVCISDETKHNLNNNWPY